MYAIYRQAWLRCLGGDEADRIYTGPDLDQLADLAGADGCHFGNAGRELVMEMLLQTIDTIGLLKPKASDESRTRGDDRTDAT
ncbi:MAG: hypothetical protein C3F11_05935 [Methylocystaceae bacterium]|nr:MAG: hypothetical protein C3F11_05935 [Methylocystaceae bacterium]